MNLSEVHSVSIYPAIGIARVGNSPEYFMAPTIPGRMATDPDDFRDAEGRIKRQAAKFFIYAHDKDGNIIGELNDSHGVKVDWEVDVANKKSAWYNFDIALDIPTAAGAYDADGNKTPGGLPVLSQRRNQDFQGEDRKLLMIEARAKHISGKDKNKEGGKYELKGTIGRQKTPVYLGELKTDEVGRLIFLGGFGHSASFTDPATPLVTFANNQGWHDDTCDGPVDAVVTLPDGRELAAEGAWVVTAPPNFAVGVQAFSTGYDLVKDVASRLHPQLVKKVPGFYADIYPVLTNLSVNQWVNAGVLRQFGWGSAHDFSDAALVERLKDKSAANLPFRQAIFNSFRNPAYEVLDAAAWPPLYGDAVTFNVNSQNPRIGFAITSLKYDYLRAWAGGDFIIDEPLQPKTWEDLSPTQQAEGLTEAALEETLGGPFHPGCEFTWPMRNAIMYSPDRPFRIKRRENQREDFGVAISQEIALAPGGPLDGSSPGDITKWMAVPWQSDTSSCLSAYRTFSGEYLPTFWPARVPNDVLTEKDFNELKEPAADPVAQLAYFNPENRKKWLRSYIFTEDGGFLGGTSIDARLKGINKFVEEWGKIGIVTRKELPSAPPYLPREVWVETGRTIDEPKPMLRGGEAAEESEQVTDRQPDWMKVNPRYLR